MPLDREKAQEIANLAAKVMKRAEVLFNGCNDFVLDEGAIRDAHADLMDAVRNLEETL